MVKYDITKAILGKRPKFELPKKEFLEQVGKDGFIKLVDDFYEELLNSEIAYFFPQDDEEELAFLKQRNGAYFMMMCGSGDNSYLTKFGGDIDQTKMHEQFSIPDKARYEWLGCWEIVLRDLKDVSDDAIQSYWNWLEVFSKHMVNFELDKDTLEDKAKN